jgi:hypothetical protein
MKQDFYMVVVKDGNKKVPILKSFPKSRSGMNAAYDEVEGKDQWAIHVVDGKTNQAELVDSSDR